MALRRAQALDFGDSWSRLYELYLLWECRNLHACVAASAVLDREVFLASTNWGWRAISADEIEFAALAQLGLGGARLSNLASRIVAASKKEQSGLFPFVPFVFAKALDVAVEHSLLPRMEAERFRADVAPLVERA